MRYLTIVRHAKAVSADKGGADYDRPLTKRGRAQSERLRQWALDPGALLRYGPTTALVSGAARTRETYALAFAGTPFVHAVETSDLIYNGRRAVSATDVLEALAALDPVTESLLVVGHNPTVLELALTIADGPVPPLADGRFPLAAAVVFRLRENEPIGLRRYPYEAGFVPED